MLNIALHPAQYEIFMDPARFKVVVAGRRFGKTRLSLAYLLTATMETERGGYDLRGREAWYIAPIYDQAKDAFWQDLLEVGQDVIDKVWVNDGKARLKSGRFIQIKGADKPHRMRGVGLSDVVMDEFADMKPQTWTSVIRPTLADVEGRALFIGTPSPEGRSNHFYELWLKAQTRAPTWRTWQYKSLDNPFLNVAELDEMRLDMSEVEYRRETEASFDNAGALVLQPETIIEGPVPLEGDVYIAIDPAGYASEEISQYSKAQLSSLDETAIAIVKVDKSYGWHVCDIMHGRWGVRETSVRILDAVRRWKPVQVGMEKGALKNAIEPYLSDQQRRLGMSFQVKDLTHGGNSKSSRITWALQGRMEHGRIKFAPGEYLTEVRQQMFQFPIGRRDDLIDALAYIDQIATTIYHGQTVEDFFVPVDAEVGY